MTPIELRPNQGTGAGAFRPVPRTGVIFVTEEALARGYRSGHPEWSNLGQGQPETGDPYAFAEGVLEPLVRAMGIEEVEGMARIIPDRVAAHALSDVIGARSEALG